MKRMTLTLVGAAASLAIVGCTNQSSDRLIGGDSYALGYDDNAGQHVQTPFDPSANMPTNPTDPEQKAEQDQKIGSPQVVAELHACSKIGYAALGTLLAARGVDLNNKKSGSAGDLYRGGQAALGIANYPGRVREMIVPATAAITKEFDIFVAAAPEIIANLTTSTACPDTQLIDDTGAFTQDGLSCLMGKPANAEYVFLANQAVNDALAKGLTQAQGQQIAVAALLEAAHTCE